MATSSSVGQQTEPEREGAVVPGQYVVVPLNAESAEDVTAASTAGARIAALEALWSAIKDRNGFRLGYNPAVATACDRLRDLERDQPATQRAFTSFCGQCGARYESQTASQAKASAEQCDHQGIPAAMFGVAAIEVMPLGVPVDLQELTQATEKSIQEICGSVDFGGWPAGSQAIHGADQHRQNALRNIGIIVARRTSDKVIDLQELAGRDMGDENDLGGHS